MFCDIRGFTTYAGSVDPDAPGDRRAVAVKAAAGIGARDSGAAQRLDDHIQIAVAGKLRHLAEAVVGVGNQ